MNYVAPMPPAIPDLSIIIPAYNEAERLPAFLDSVLAGLKADGRNFEVIVVDDGSEDATADCVRQRLSGSDSLRLIRHEHNAGKGAAVRTGMLGARGVLRLFADADGATRINELPRLEKAIRDGAAIAIGSRESNGSEGVEVKCSPVRRFLGRWFNRAVRMGSIRGIGDTQCGFKLFRADIAAELFGISQEDGFAFDVEILFLAQQQGVEIAEVPVNWTEQPGSKVSLWRDGLKMLRAVSRLKKRWRRGGYTKVEVRVTPSHEVTASPPVSAPVSDA